MGNVLGIQISCDALFNGCTNCTRRNAAYVSQLEDNLANLQTQLQKLIEAKDDVMTRVANAEQHQMRRLNKVQGWLSRVESVEAEVGELIRHSTREIDKLCLGGYCSKNCQSSYNFGKKVSKKLQLMDTLMGEGAFDVVAEKVPQPAVDERPLEPTIVGLDSTFDKVWRCLIQEQVGIIGLYGMGGVGKTTLLTQINNKFLDAPNNFDVVIWVVVSKDMQLESVQEKIGERIGFLENRSLEEKASGIFKILSKKKFLLLLDDIWERIDLAKLGVPFPAISKNASKIIFTTRLENVCGLIEAQKKFKVECLGDNEAWELFLQKVGEETLGSHPDIPELAKTVAKECCGLPLALITTGRAMSGKKTPEEWNYSIEMLRRSASEFPGKIELIECWIGEGFLNGYEGINGVHNKGHYIIGVLVQACLLEEVGSDYVKMHDVIRDIALWIACEVEKENENFLVSAGVELTKPPERLLSCQQLHSSTRALELRRCEDSKSWNILSIADLKYLDKLDFAYCTSLEVLRVNYAEIVHIESCYDMDEIISAWKLGDVPGLNPFAKLQYLRLQVLTKLKIIFRNALPFPNLLELFISECPNLKKLPLDINSAKEGKTVIRGDQHWWNELKWEDESTLNAFLPCFESI
ncbi:hypothetical protein WN944_022447 [Citrus x changshan-huyou]|uniref:NB-ARC domain-containing protein n=1 Tax=Citrus x changshan-huyou TaxID=2935761 RepID=A0AAP0R0G4_9ROSI